MEIEHSQYRSDLTAHLSEFVTPQRLQLFRKVLRQRTRYVTVLFEDIYQSQNASAVLRTCDCTGIQDVHIVEYRNTYDVNPDVALGSDRWLSLYNYREQADPLESSIALLKSKGYRIVATTPHIDGHTPESFDLGRGKAAFMFGTELNGLTERALEYADEHIRIPMAGFTESFNISVSAAIILYRIRSRLDESGLDWRLSEEEESELLLNWLRTSVKCPEELKSSFAGNIRTLFSFL